MPTHEEHILRILGEASEPLFTSEITEFAQSRASPGRCVHDNGSCDATAGSREGSCATAGWSLDAETIAALTIWWEGERHGNITSRLLPKLQKDGNCAAPVG